MLSRLKFEIEPLVNQMLDQLPDQVWTDPNITFLDPAMGGGQFLVEIQRRLRAAGHSDENISARMWGCETNILRVNYAKNNKKLVSNHLFISEFLDHDWGDMKFDVIVGNPPYQKEGQPNSHNLWTQFVTRTWDLLAANGHLGLVTPNIGKRADVLPLFLENHVLWYNGFDTHKYFNVGSTFCSWVINKSSPQVTRCLTSQGIETLEIKNLPFIPLQLNQSSVDFIHKMTQGDVKLNVRTDWGYHGQGKKDWFSDTQSRKFKYKFQNTSASIKWCSEDHECRTKPKVICSKSGYLNPWYDKGEVGVTENSWVIPVKNGKQAQKIIDFLNSDDVKRFVNLATGGNTLVNDPAIYRMISYSE